ncbi:unnamed protein product [Rhodiola kirilowii]
MEQSCKFAVCRVSCWGWIFIPRTLAMTSKNLETLSQLRIPMNFLSTGLKGFHNLNRMIFTLSGKATQGIMFLSWLMLY